MVLTYKQKFNIKYGFPKDKSHSVEEIAKLTGYKLSGLKTILSKGQAAFFSNRKSVRPHVKSSEHWKFSRLYASIDKSSKSYQIDKSHLIKS